MKRILLGFLALGGVAQADFEITSGRASVESLFPIAVGHTWTYEVTNTSTTACAAGERQSKVVSKSEKNGKELFRVTPICPQAVASEIHRSANAVDSHFYSGTARLLEGPVKEGHTWNYWGSSIKASWKSVAKVDVPYAKLNDCWVAVMKTGGSAIENVYCPGVGLAKFTYQDAKGTLSAELKAKNF